MEKKKHTYNRDQALYRVAAICSKGEQCSGDIRAKLENWDLQEKEISDIIAYLKAEKYLDDDRYARAYCRDKAKFEGWGRIKIIYNLRHKGVAATTIDDAILAIDDDDYRERLYGLLKAKARTLQGKDTYKAKASLYRFAASRGFESDLIFPAINKILGDDSD